MTALWHQLTLPVHHSWFFRTEWYTPILKLDTFHLSHIILVRHPLWDTRLRFHKEWIAPLRLKDR